MSSDGERGDAPSRWRAIRRALSSLTSGGSSLEGSGGSPGGDETLEGGGGWETSRARSRSRSRPTLDAVRTTTTTTTTNGGGGGGGHPQLFPRNRTVEAGVCFVPGEDGRRHATTFMLQRLGSDDIGDASRRTSTRGYDSNAHDATFIDDHGPIGPWNDRGNCYYEAARKKFALPGLVATGRHAGKSMVRMRGRSLLGLITFDGFTTLVEMPWRYLVVFVASLYIASFLAYAGVWFGISRLLPGCLSGFEEESHGFNAAVIFSVATQTTIGYGTRSIVGSCRTGTFVLLCQSLTAVFVSALSIGLIFQRIADPKHRTRSVFISDAACISCRDGELTFMFRVGDARDRKVINPNIRACLYTWDGRRTKEGEHLPVVAKPMEIAYQDGHMLLPITITHVIDESSPLYRHTHDSLVACGAEVVVSLEGQIETTGLSFSARQSYLPQEILWSHQFVRIIRRARPGEARHEVNLRRFHELVPQSLLESDRCVARCGVQRGGRALLTAQQMSEATLEAARGGGRGCVPFPAAGTNTLVVSDAATLSLVRANPSSPNPGSASDPTPTPPSSAASDTAAASESPDLKPSAKTSDANVAQGRLVLSFRIGDSRSPWGSHLAGAEVRLHMHRWNSSGEVGHVARELSMRCKGETGVGTKGGTKVSLWAPVVVEHEVDESSPLRSALVEGWPVIRSPDDSSGYILDGSAEDVGGGWGEDASHPQPRMTLAPDVELVAEVQAVMCSNGTPVVRRRCYRARDLRVGREFVPIVFPSSRRALWAEPRVDFDEFHTTAPVRND